MASRFSFRLSKRRKNSAAKEKKDGTLSDSSSVGDNGSIRVKNGGSSSNNGSPTDKTRSLKLNNDNGDNNGPNDGSPKNKTAFDGFRDKTGSISSKNSARSGSLGFLRRQSYRIGTNNQDAIYEADEDSDRTDSYSRDFTKDSASSRATSPTNGLPNASNAPGGKRVDEKLGHRRVDEDGVVSYKKTPTTELEAGIQLGLHYYIAKVSNKPAKDLLYQASI